MSALDTTRRALLAGAAAVGSVDVLPYARAQAMSVISVEHSDVKLLALRPAWERSMAAMTEASRLLDEAEGRYDPAPEPTVLHVQQGDQELFGRISKDISRPGEPSVLVITNARRIARFEEQLATPALTPWQVRRHARMRELVAGFAAWKAENHRRWSACNLDAVNTLWRATAMKANDLRKRIANEPALTAAGMAFKTKVVMDCYSGEFEEELRYRISAGDGSDEALTASIMLDLCLAQSSGRVLT